MIILPHALLRVLEAAAVDNSVVAVLELAEGPFAVLCICVLAFEANLDSFLFESLRLYPLLVVVAVFADLVDQARG